MKRLVAAVAAWLAAAPALAQAPASGGRAEETRRTMQTYVEALNAGDVDRILALYAEDATVEDPVGSPLKQGHKAIGDFYRGVAALHPVASLTPPIAPAADGASAAMTFQIKVGPRSLTVIEFMTFTPAGKIATMKAYSAPNG